MKAEEKDACGSVEEVLPGLTWCAALNAVDAVMLGILNTDAQFLWVNHALACFFSRSPGECIGEYCYTLFDDEKLRGWFQAGLPEEPLPLIESGRNKLSCSIRSLDHGDTANGYLLVASDVTEVSDNESALCAFREREECARLRHECVMEKISHEFRTTLMSISGLVEFLKDTHVSTEQQEFVDGLASCVGRSMSMLDSYLREDQEDERAEHYPDLGAGASQAVASSPPPRKVKPEAEKVRVLLAEDNLINAKVVEKMLSNAGYAVDVAENGLEVVKRIEVNDCQYDLILMDCEMPKMNGYDATTRVRKAGWEGSIIALTADATIAARKRCMAVGMDAYVTKPVRCTQLCQIISDALVVKPEGNA